jgi:hypothetical protein
MRSGLPARGAVDHNGSDTQARKRESSPNRARRSEPRRAPSTLCWSGPRRSLRRAARAQQVAGPQQLGGGKAPDLHVAQDDALDDQQSGQARPGSVKAVALPRATGHAVLDGHRPHASFAQLL